MFIPKEGYPSFGMTMTMILRHVFATQDSCNGSWSFRQKIKHFGEDPSLLLGNMS